MCNISLCIIKAKGNCTGQIWKSEPKTELLIWWRWGVLAFCVKRETFLIRFCSVTRQGLSETDQPNVRTFPGSNYWLCSYFYEERWTCIVMIAAILNITDEYLFVEGGQNDQFKSQDYRGLKMTSERWQHHNVIFTQRLVNLLVKSGEFINICWIMCQWWPFKNGERALFKFFSKVCPPVTQEV